MIIGHNMPAISAYNNNNRSVAGIKKASEKLASGLRINRAGDDAAGLAVSEKMRSQLRGIKQSIRNCQDGIDLIRTFEGALGETVSIIHRMKELAVQSANGTYDNGTDRTVISTEYMQLRDELNHIAETDFNGTVLLSTEEDLILNSGLDPTGGSGDNSFKIYNTLDIRNIQNETDVDWGTVSMEFLTIPDDQADAEMSDALASLDSVKVTADVSGDAAKFGFSDSAPSGFAFVPDPRDPRGATLRYTKSDGSSVAVARLAVPLTVKTGITAKGSAATDHHVAHCSSNGSQYTGCGVNTCYIHTVTDNAQIVDRALRFEGNKGTGNAVTLTLQADLNTFDITPGGGTCVMDDLLPLYGFECKGNGSSDPQNIGIINNQSKYYIYDKITANATLSIGGAAAGFSRANLPDAFIKEAYTAHKSGGFTYTYNGGKWYDAGGSDVTARMNLIGADLTGARDGDTFSCGGIDIDHYVEFEGQYMDPNKPDTSFASDDAVIDPEKATDGAVYIFDGNNWVDRANNVVPDLADVGVTLPAGYTPIKGNRLQISVKHGPNRGKVSGTLDADYSIMDDPRDTVVSRRENLGTAVMTYPDTLILQTNSRSKDSVEFKFTYVSDGIGDLPNNLNCTAKGLGIDMLWLGSQEEANHAIDRLDLAVNKTSMIRATFGTAQNRLEHKCDNLTNTYENLTTAESGVRDTDMAREMMNFTKSNIIQQAAQSMLAQANQLPQSVLQLLN